jgi:hypothetical protein
MKKLSRLIMALAMGVALLGGAAAASADPPKGPANNCDKAHRDPAKRFEAADKNKDGFLTKDEVGERRWARISVADTNKDSKVSKAELDKARADGKLGHHKRGPGGQPQK